MSFAAIKVLRQALALQIAATGPDDPQVKQRKEQLLGALGGTGDIILTARLNKSI